MAHMAIFKYIFFIQDVLGRKGLKGEVGFFKENLWIVEKSFFCYFPPQTWKRKEKMCKSKSIGIVEEIKKSFFHFFLLTETVGASVCLSSYEILFLYIISQMTQLSN
jgi:hypothetical protein